MKSTVLQFTREMFWLISACVRRLQKVEGSDSLVEGLRCLLRKF
jgi:hypothetical protein